MRKLFLIALKDLKLIYRDPAALILMLLAPFLLTVGMGAVTGRFSGGSSSGISNIPVTIINQDGGQLGNALVEMFASPELDSLLAPIPGTDIAAAKASVDADESAAVIIIPPGFTDSVIPSTTELAPVSPVQIELYANPTRPTSTGILKAILDQFLSQVEIGRVSGEVVVSQLIQGGYISPEQAPAVGIGVGQEMALSSGRSSSITLNNLTASGEVVNFDILSYMAPGMALMFLMFTVTYGGRSLQIEGRQGTLPRLLISPTSSAQVLAGKVTGVFLTAVAQLLILIVGTSLMFRLYWGDAFGVLALILAAAFGATGWGLVIAAFLKTPGQIASVGSGVMLLFGVLGGSFFDLSILPNWIRIVNKITPNAWGIEGFYTLALGGTLQHILPNLIALVVMGMVLFIVSSLWITRHGLARK